MFGKLLLSLLPQSVHGSQAQCINFVKYSILRAVFGLVLHYNIKV